MREFPQQLNHRHKPSSNASITLFAHLQSTPRQPQATTGLLSVSVILSFLEISTFLKKKVKKPKKNAAVLRPGKGKATEGKKDVSEKGLEFGTRPLLLQLPDEQT